MKRILLGTTALAAISLASLPAVAGPVTASDSFDLSLGLEFRQRLDFTSQDQTTGAGRGYSMAADEGELKVRGKKKGDNGLEYGFQIELNTLTSDGLASDESWMYVEGDWGRVEMGDQDSANDRILVEATDISAGRAGVDGDIGDIWATGLDMANVNSQTSDDPKITYFTPRFSGFQLGASLTPDTGAAGFTRDADNDGDFENVIGLAAGYSGTFSGVKVNVSGMYEFGESEIDTSAAVNPAGGTNEHDLEMWGFGATVEYAGFGLGGGWVDLGKSGVLTTAVTDAGEWWNLGASYGTGPWKVSGSYYESQRKIAATVTRRDQVIAFDGQYVVAPGWTTMAALYLVDSTNFNVAGADNDGHIVLFSNQFSF